jgi:hypothetical protein
MKRSSSDAVAASNAIDRTAARFPMWGLGLRYAGQRTSEAFAVERSVPNAYLVSEGYPERFWIYTDGTPVVPLPIRSLPSPRTRLALPR